MEGYSYNPPCTCTENPDISPLAGPIAEEWDKSIHAPATSKSRGTSQSNKMHQGKPIATHSGPIATSQSSGITTILATSPPSGTNQVGPTTINPERSIKSTPVTQQEASTNQVVVTIQPSGITQDYPVGYPNYVPVQLDPCGLPCATWSPVGKRGAMGATPPESATDEHESDPSAEEVLKKLLESE